MLPIFGPKQDGSSNVEESSGQWSAHSTRDLAGNSVTASGRVVTASMEAPLDHEELLHLLERVLCENEDFIAASNFLWIKLNR
jgi:hypothetical protein